MDQTAQLALASGWVEKYGPAMEPEERAELDGQLAATAKGAAVEERGKRCFGPGSPPMPC